MKRSVADAGHLLWNDSGEEHFKKLFDQSPDPTWIIKANRFVNCNDAAVRFLGYKTKEELLSCHPSDLSPEFQPDGERSFEKAERILRDVMDRGAMRFEWVHAKADGTIFPAEVTLATIDLR